MTAGHRSPGLSYTPYHELDGRANVIADGAPCQGTVLCLTHWPGITSPPDLQADLSAEMAFAYLHSCDRHATATAASNNHFDQDGLVSLFALTRPEEALQRQGLLEDIARAGDFATFQTRTAARISMAIAAFADPERTSLHLAADYPTKCTQLYEELLGRLPELCDHPERVAPLWAEEDACLQASQTTLTTRCLIEEDTDLDLAVITLPEDAPSSGGHRFASMWVDGLHPMALCNATNCTSILVITGRHYRFTYRYETWVQYRSRRPRPRVDLGPLAKQLDNEETSGGHW